MLTDTTMRRLAFIKYLYTRAVEASSQPEPLAAASLLTFHDSVELFLHLASEQLNVGTKQPNFMDYFDLLEPKLPPAGLAHKESMRTLNKARVALKHHGTFPSRLSVEAFRQSVTGFFEDNCPLVFKIEFSAISMLNLVRCAETRANLEKATELLGGDQREEALNTIALAFAQLIDDYENRKRSDFGRSPFFFGRSLTFESSFFLKVKDRDFARFVDKVKEAIESMQDAMKVLALGLDYRRYSKFRRLTPRPLQSISGEFVIQSLSWQVPPSRDACQDCIDFVVDSALQLQSGHFGLDDAQEGYFGIRRMSLDPPTRPANAAG